MVRVYVLYRLPAASRGVNVMDYFRPKMCNTGQKNFAFVANLILFKKTFSCSSKIFTGISSYCWCYLCFNCDYIKAFAYLFFYRVCSLQRLRQNLNGSPLNTSSGQNLLNFCDLIRIGVVPALPLQPTSHCRQHHIFGKLATSNFSRHENRISH